MSDDRIFFYPGTADCQPPVSAYPDFTGFVPPPAAPSNTMGGYGGLLDINDYNGSGTSTNIFISPDAALLATGVRDLMTAFNTPPGCSWYLMRQTDFKDWIGVAGIFWKPTNFIMEIDIFPTTVNKFGGYRNEAPNLSLASTAFTVPTGFSPYALGAAQGNGISLQAVVTDSITHLEVIKDSHIFTGTNGEDPFPLGPNPLVLPRQTIQLNLAGIKPEEMASMVLRIKTEQYAYLNTVFPLNLDSTIYRIGLTPDPASLRSSGKQSAALTSR